MSPTTAPATHHHIHHHRPSTSNSRNDEDSNETTPLLAPPGPSADEGLSLTRTLSLSSSHAGKPKPKQKQKTQKEADELPPLTLLPPDPLSPSDFEDDEEEEEGKDERLPRAQLFWLCYARAVEPVAFFCIFPFVNAMIWENARGGVARAEVGFWSGVVESLFSLTQMLVMLPWGWAADRWGRKPVLVTSLAGLTVATTLFGFSRTVGEMVFFRCLAGVFAGTVVTLRVMITENSTAKTQARAFSFFSFTGNLGIFLGPAIGGGLSKPAEHFPSLFGHIQLFQTYPYALSTIVTGSIALSATITSALFVKETLPKHRRASRTSSSSSHRPRSTWSLLRYPGIAYTLYLYAHAMLLAFAYTAIAPVFWFTPVSLGGFGFSPAQISLFMSLGGVSQALWTLLVFPPLQRRWGTARVLAVCAAVWPVWFALNPGFNWLLRQDEPQATTAFWVLAPTAVVLGHGVCMAFVCVQLLLNAAAPGPAELGRVNALALAMVSGIRAVTPAASASLFAVGVRGQVLGGYLAWVVLVGLGVGLVVGCRAAGKVERGEYRLLGEVEEQMEEEGEEGEEA